MDMKKKEYTKPSIKLVEWEFSEAICQTVTTTSFSKCITIDKGNSVNQVEIRADQTGSWNRVGSTSSNNW